MLETSIEGCDQDVFLQLHTNSSSSLGNITSCILDYNLYNKTRYSYINVAYSRHGRFIQIHFFQHFFHFLIKRKKTVNNHIIFSGVGYLQ